MLVGRVLRRHNGGHARGAQTRQVARRALQVLHEDITKRLAVCGVLEWQSERARLGDDLLKETSTLVRQQMIRDGCGTGGLALQRDGSCIATEAGDVSAHPLQRQALVAEPEVALHAVLHEEAQRAEPIVGGHHDEARGIDPAPRIVQKSGRLRV